MVRYWEYVICPMIEQQNLSQVAVYNCSRMLFRQIFQYCREHNGTLYMLNAHDLVDDALWYENRENLVLINREQHSEKIELGCQVLLVEGVSAYQNYHEAFENISMPECRMVVSNLKDDTEHIFEKICGGQRKLYHVSAVPFGGIDFYLQEELCPLQEKLVRSETLWKAVEEERKYLETELQKKTVRAFTERSYIYNSEAVIRREEIGKIRKEYKEKIKAIKGSKRYRIGNKIAGAVDMLRTNKKQDIEKTSSKKKNLDQLAEYFGIIGRTELFELYLKYSPILKTLRLPLSECEQAVVDEMESLRQMDGKLYREREQEDLVTVIMPTYNRESVIGDAIESVLRQSYRRFELLIVDDFSTDRTEDVIRKYEDDGRVHYLRNTHVKGVCGARNTGLERANGKWIAYLDSDNEWEPDYLLLSIQKLKENLEYHSIYTAQRVWRMGKEDKTIHCYRFGIYSPAMLENRNYVDMNSYIHSRQMYQKFGGFDEGLKRMTDWELILRYSRHEIPYAYPVLLCNYFEEGKQQDRISDVVDENYSLFATRFNYNKLCLEEADTVIETGYEMYSNADCRVYAKREGRPAIIIPNYEALGCLILCIASIRKFSKAYDYEIIIVDNCSSKTVQEYLKRIANEPDIRVIQNDYNMGFTYAVNQGIKAARPGSDYVLLNNDAIVTENWLEELYEVKRKIPEAGLIVPRQVLIPHTKTMNIHVPGCNKNREIDVNLSFHHKNIVDVTTYAREGYIELSFAAFFLVMITDKCFEKLGLLDEVNGRHYKSDRLYCQKATEYGVKMIYTPFSKAYHLLQQSTVQLKQQDEKMYEIIFKKNNWDDLQGKIL